MFIKLTCEEDNKPFWVNVNHLSYFGPQHNDKGTYICTMTLEKQMDGPNVIETPSEILEKIQACRLESSRSEKEIIRLRKVISTLMMKLRA